MWGRVKSLLGQARRLRSLRVYIFFIVLIAGIVPGVLMRYTIVDNYEEQAIALRQNTVQNQLRIVANHLISKNYMEIYRLHDVQSVASQEVIDAELEMLSNLYDGRVLIIGSNFKVIKDTYGISEGKMVISEEVIRCFMGETISKYDKENGYIEMTTPIIGNAAIVTESQDEMLQAAEQTLQVQEPVIKGVMLTSIADDDVVDTMEILSRKAIILEIIVIMITITMAFVLSSVLTRPFIQARDAIKDVREGYSNKAIKGYGYREAEHVIEAFNQLLYRMKVLDESRQEFVANVSHELKTPLTSMKVLAESLVTQDDVPAELYREFMEDIVSEIDRENQIITDLLSLVKMDKKAQKLNIVSLNINDLTELILKRLRPIARKQDVEVVFESNRTVTAEVDEVKMTLILSNLVENAIKYNKEHGWVKVMLDADHQYFTLQISDSGIGIPQESVAQIYERFYRVDKSHSREIGGTGLGLAITKNAVLMHRGSIAVSSKEGEGTTFTVKIPLNYISQQN